MHPVYHKCLLVSKRKDELDLAFAKCMWLQKMKDIFELMGNNLECDRVHMAARLFCVEDIKLFKDELLEVKSAVDNLVNLVNELPQSVEEVKKIREEELNEG